MNEKEVQVRLYLVAVFFTAGRVVCSSSTNCKKIWFQNRRQINRRKSRPLLPHEIAAYSISGIAALSSGPLTDGFFSSSQSCGEAELRVNDTLSQDHSGTSSQEIDQVSEHRNPEASAIEMKEEPHGTILEGAVSSPPTIPELGIQASADTPSSGSSLIPGPENVFKSFSSTPGYLSNRWNTVSSAFSTPSSFRPSLFTTPTM